MVVGDLTWVKGSYQSVSGLISTDWKLRNGVFTLDVLIPANTTASIYIPSRTERNVTESGKQINKTNGVKFIKMKKEYAIYEIGSGSYHFESEERP